MNEQDRKEARPTDQEQRAPHRRKAIMAHDQGHDAEAQHQSEDGEELHAAIIAEGRGSLLSRAGRLGLAPEGP
jgi:hypothetical protein